MGRLEVHISHGGGPDLSGIAALAMLGFAVTVAAEVIASVIWWLVTITAVVAVTVPAAGVLTWRATRHREARYAAFLAARRAAVPAQPARALPPGPVYHLHFHGTDAGTAARCIGRALPASANHRPGRTS